MSRRRRFIASLVVAATGVSLAAVIPNAGATSSTADASIAPIEESLTGTGDLRAFVQYDHPVTDADVAALQALGVVKLHRYDLVPFVAVITPRSVLDRIASIDGVLGIQQDHGLHLDLYESKKATKVDLVRKPVSEGGLGLNGKGVRVAVIDSGVDSSHPDLADRVVTSYNFEGGWIFDQYQDGAASDDVAGATAQYAQVDEVGHGTHVASTIAGTGAAAKLPTGSGRDLSGMAPGAGIISYKVASPAQGVVYDMGWEANTMAAIEHLIEHNSELGIKVINNSWGIFEVTDPDSEPVIQMVRAGIAKGLLFVFSAGNSGPEDNTVGWPGAMGNVITVAATKKVAPFDVSSFSSRGYQVDIAAPGEDILAARSKVSVIDFGLSVPDAGTDAPYYMGISGTSMSAPHISGISALLLEANPKLTAPKIEEILERTAADLGDAGKDHLYGYGFVNANKAARVALCLKDTPNSDYCYTRFNALPASKWASDWKDKGDSSPTDQGGVIPSI